MVLFNSIPLLFFTPHFSQRSFWKTNLCHFLHPHFLFWLVGVYTQPDVGPGSNRWIFCWDRGIHWIHLDLSDISSSQVAEVKTGDKEISIQIAQVQTSGLGELESSKSPVWWFLGEWRVNLGQHCFCYCIIIDSTNKMAIIPSMKMIKISHLDHFQRYRIW